MNKVVLFDIDGTLFDPRLFLENFYKRLQEAFPNSGLDEDTLKYFYLESKTLGYFTPNNYLPKILNKIGSENKDELEAIFWDQTSINECLYQDSTIVEAVGKLATPAIFSTGESRYQRVKISAFADTLKNENIFIFDDKLKAFKEILEKFTGYKTYLVDDRADILEEAKDINPDSFAILINREKFEAKSDKIDALVGNLYEILPILE